MAKNGTMDFDSDNAMLFIAGPTPTQLKNACRCDSADCTKRVHVDGDGRAIDFEGPSHMMEWKSTPAAMARALRRAADWLDKHSTEDIKVNID